MLYSKRLSCFSIIDYNFKLHAIFFLENVFFFIFLLPKMATSNEKQSTLFRVKGKKGYYLLI
jgi:hypothetical protein